VTRVRVSRRFLATCALAGLSLAGLLSGGAPATAGMSAMRWPFVLLDATNDANGGPDVTKIEQGGDKDAQMIGLRLTIANYAADSGFNIFFDTDHNRSTGSNGYEYMLYSQGNSWNLNVADGAGGWKRSTPAAADLAFRDGDVFEFRLSADDLGGGTYFNFVVVTFTSAPGDGGTPVLTAADFAPDRGGFTYSLDEVANFPATPPLIKMLGTKPVTPRAGKPFVAQFAIVDRDTQLPAVAARVVLSMSIGGKSLRSTMSVRDGVAIGRATIPPRARGHTLTVMIVAALGGSKTRQQKAFRIR
jgi:hypothetical protein